MIEVQITPLNPTMLYRTYRLVIQYQDGMSFTRTYGVGDLDTLKLDLLLLMLWQAVPDVRSQEDVPILDALADHYEESTDADERLERFFREFGRYDFINDLLGVKNLAVFYHDDESVVHECRFDLRILDEQNED